MTARAQHHSKEVDELLSLQVEGITKSWYFWRSFREDREWCCTAEEDVVVMTMTTARAQMVTEGGRFGHHSVNVCCVPALLCLLPRPLPQQASEDGTLISLIP